MAGGTQKNSDDLSPVADINITPLVDVMLVLLVIFMVTAPLMENGVSIDLPKASTKALQAPEDPVTLYLARDKRIYLGRDEIHMNEVRTQVIKTMEKRNRKEIFIRADGALPYSAVALAIAEVKNAGVSRIGLVTLPDKEQK